MYSEICNIQSKIVAVKHKYLLLHKYILFHKSNSNFSFSERSRFCGIRANTVCYTVQYSWTTSRFGQFMQDLSAYYLTLIFGLYFLLTCTVWLLSCFVLCCIASHTQYIYTFCFISSITLLHLKRSTGSADTCPQSGGISLVWASRSRAWHSNNKTVWYCEPTCLKAGRDFRQFCTKIRKDVVHSISYR